MADESRVEEQLDALIDRTTYQAPRMSRIEDQLQEILESGITKATKWIGVTTTGLTDGASTNPIVINGSSVTAETGDIASYENEEFIFNGTVWQAFGSGSGLPEVTSSDNGKNLSVVNGRWAAKDESPFVVTYMPLDNDSCDFDHTLEEMYSAYEAGRKVVGRIDMVNTYYELSMVENNLPGSVRFSACVDNDTIINIHHDQNNATFTSSNLSSYIPLPISGEVTTGDVLCANDIGGVYWSDIKGVPDGGNTGSPLIKNSLGDVAWGDRYITSFYQTSDFVNFHFSNGDEASITIHANSWVIALSYNQIQGMATMLASLIAQADQAPGTEIKVEAIEPYFARYVMASAAGALNDDYFVMLPFMLPNGLGVLFPNCGIVGTPEFWLSEGSSGTFSGSFVYDGKAYSMKLVFTMNGNIFVTLTQETGFITLPNQEHTVSETISEITDSINASTYSFLKAELESQSNFTIPFNDPTFDSDVSGFSALFNESTIRITWADVVYFADIIFDDDAESFTIDRVYVFD